MIFLVCVAIATVKSLSFSCQFEDRSQPPVGIVYQCRPTITGSGYTLEYVTGAHLSGRSNAQVDGLQIYSQTMTSLPSNIHRFFPNLAVLYIYNSNLRSISADDLWPFPNLLVFFTHSNPLVSLDGDLFIHTQKLRLLLVYYSQLQHVGYNLLKHLGVLMDADLRGNPCINAQANTKETIEALNHQLPISCPPSATTHLPTSTTHSPSECPYGCSRRIYELESKTAELSNQNAN